jgi:hypothetical protein
MVQRAFPVNIYLVRHHSILDILMAFLSLYFSRLWNFGPTQYPVTVGLATGGRLGLSAKITVRSTRLLLS